MNKNIVVREIDNLDTAVEVINRHSDCQYIRLGDEPDSVEKFAKKQLEYGHFLAEYIDEEPVGYVCFYANDQINKRAYVTALVVSGTGLLQGRLFYNLIEKAIIIGINAGMTSLKVEVDKLNTHARRLYEKMGFEYTGEENERSIYMLISKEKLTDKLRIRIGDK